MTQQQVIEALGLKARRRYSLDTLTYYADRAAREGLLPQNARAIIVGINHAVDTDRLTTNAVVMLRKPTGSQFCQLFAAMLSEVEAAGEVYKWLNNAAKAVA